MIPVSLLDKDLIGSFSQSFSVFLREDTVASFDKIMVKGGVGVFWRTDGHLGELQIVDRVGGNCGGDRIVLPFLVRLSNQDSSTEKSKTDNTKPKNLCRLCLKERNENMS